MSWPISTAAYYALRQSGAVRVRAKARTAVQGVIEIPITGGSVTFDSGSNVRRQGTVSLPNDPSYWPDNPFSVLSPWGTQIEVEFGITLPGGAVEYVPLMIGAITKTPWKIGGTDEISVTIADGCSYLADDRFDVNTSTTSTKTVVATITDFVKETRPDATVIDRTGDTKACPVIDMQRDRLAGIVKLAESIGAEFFCDRVGNFVIAPQATVNDPMTFTLSGADLVISADYSADRDRIYNRVFVSGETNSTSAGGTTSQTPPVTASAQDDDPESPTFYGGPFGRKSRFYVSALITTTAQAQSTAGALLEKARGLGRTVTFGTITDPTLDAGDVGLVTVRGRTEKHVTDSVTIPLKVGETQSIATRTQALPDEQEQA